MECNAVNQCYDNTPLKRPNTPPLLGVAPNTLTQPANTPKMSAQHPCVLPTCHNTPWAVTPLKPNTPRAFFFNSEDPVILSTSQSEVQIIEFCNFLSSGSLDIYRKFNFLIGFDPDYEILKNTRHASNETPDDVDWIV